MKITKVTKAIDNSTGSPKFRIELELDVTLELLRDMHSANALDVETELASILGGELVNLLKEYNFEN